MNGQYIAGKPYPLSPAKMYRARHSFACNARRLLIALLAITLIILYMSLPPYVVLRDTVMVRELGIGAQVTIDTASLPSLSFASADLSLYRTPDTVDSFSDYKYRPECNISSLDLHVPHFPLCSSRTQMLEAMSGGGRIGFDAPYTPRGCNMRWFTTEEICEILGRFDKVVFLGDSMIRHIVGALNVFLRKDLGYGAVTDWNFSQQEKRDCFCLTQFNVKTCSVQGIFKTADVELHDPQSLACPAQSVNVFVEEMVRYPIAPEELERLSAALGTEKATKPLAFIYGMGLWNNLDIHAAANFLTTVENSIIEQLPHLRPTLSGVPPFFPRLFVTPSASGKEKLDEWEQSQGNRALMLYEESIRRIAREREGMEVLGTWNATIQMNKYDGVHVDLRGNLLKTMMVLNWLNLLREV